MSWDRSWEPEFPSPTESFQARLDRQRRERLEFEILEAGSDIDNLTERLEVERLKVAELNELQAHKRALLVELRALDQERTAAVKETKDIERRLKFQQQQTEQAGRIKGPRYGRPVRVDVDDGAWEAIRLVTIEQRTTLRFYVGELVTAEAALLGATPDLGPPSSRRRRSPGEGSPRPRRRFLRIEVDDNTWTTIRLAATTTGLATSRYLGQVIEADAHCLGWRRSSGRS